MINVGIIGAGFIGRNHFNQYEALAERARVVAISDRVEARRLGDWSEVGGNVGDMQGTRRDLKGAKPYADWRELIADPAVQMVDICTPTYLHAEMAIAALEAGKHVLCEKPMALTVEECDEMLKAAAKAKGKFMIAQCIRFWPECAFVKQCIEDGRYGALKAVNLRRQASTPGYSFENWLLDPSLSGGAILDLHVHDVDYTLWLLGKPQAVTAQAATRAGTNSYDRVHSLWHYPDGPVVQIEGFWDMPDGFGFNMGLTILFEKAAIVWDLCTGKPMTVFRQGEKTGEVPEVGANTGYFNEIEYFLDCIEKDRTPTVSTPQQSRDAVMIALAEKQSATTGKTVTIA
ncbi:MAG TPA: Gfo/Idh/MocA family oxidoreductase [Phycisphaerae bacterium]|nr:Gfo/Idh/MocA family oxidoreductase [Phycisphaerae bacterium]HOJ75776.1 Gfo/Idh/MocA family oxidoreductase [Phycisphaerae bacterium]HOM51443.1 Gfo/Idh/MocA family oxidoreductase [Phycisphaerae bacterium]HON69111.1 Gfo/Idh/MocA family oxidoreductase [Phycisphaerae bacterium]HOQ86529.1 Gfo/Idh/MocA family oxidoreductase [Phycisphaerae bacterium]